MKLHRFFIEHGLDGRSIRVDDPEFFNQLKDVLKLRSGEEVILFNGGPTEVVARIVQYGKDSVSLEPVRTRKNGNEPAKQVVLYCSVLKKENFELVVQKAVEVGAKEIIPVISVRTVKLNLRADRLAKIAKEAAEQSGRAIVPVVHEPMKWDEAVAHSKNNESNFFFHPERGEDFSGTDAGKIGVWIGPEGGWTGEEARKAQEAGFDIARLGKLVLRAETAAIVATYLVTHGG